MNYTREDMITFLEAVDEELSKPTTLVVIGGASLSLAYNPANTTMDMDLLNRITDELNVAIEKAKQATQIDIRVSTTRVYAEIMHMESRFQTPEDIGTFNHLSIFVLEKHDLALMKAARLEMRDLEDIRNLHRKDSLDSQILFERFENELLPLNSGDDSLLKQKFLEMIEALFGEDKAAEFESKF